MRSEATNIVLGVASASVLAVLFLFAMLAKGSGAPTASAVAMGYTAVVLAFSLYTAVSVLAIARTQDAQARLTRADRLMPLVIGYAIVLGLGCVGVVPAALVVWRCMRFREAVQALAMEQASRPEAPR